MESLGTLLPILLIGVVFYLLIMRPARTRQRKQMEMMSALAPGTRVMTTAGVYGTVVSIDAIPGAHDDGVAVVQSVPR